MAAVLSPIYQEQFYLGVIEELARTVDVFNAGSNGTLLLGSDQYMGDYIQEAMYDRIPGLIQRRDINVDTAVADLSMSLQEHVGVDVAHRVGPVFQKYEDFERRGRSIDEMAQIIGQQFAGDFLARGLDLIVSALVAATDNVSALKNATLNTQTTNYKHLVAGQKIFGDQFRNVDAYLMNSESFFDLMGDGLDNYKIDDVAGARIVSGVTQGALGKPIIVSDIPSLTYDAGAGDLKNRVLSLTTGAGSVIERGAARILVDDKVLGQENLGIRYQAETNTRLSVKGYAWDIANGGQNPTDAALATGSNWDLVVDPKNAAASIVETEAANAP